MRGLAMRFNRLPVWARFALFAACGALLTFALLSVPTAWRGWAFVAVVLAVWASVGALSRHPDSAEWRTGLAARLLALRQHSGRLRALVLAGVLVSMTAAALNARPFPSDDWLHPLVGGDWNVGWRWWWFGVGGMGVYLWLSPRTAPAPFPRWRWLTFKPQADERGIRWHAFLVGLLPIAAVLQANTLSVEARLEFFDRLFSFPLLMQIGGLLLGWGLCAWALSGASLPRWRAWRLPMTRHTLLVLAGLGAALLVRLLWLETWILRWLDEIHYASAVWRTWEAMPLQALRPFSDLTAFSWFYPFAQATVVSFAGATLWSLRFVSALFGVAGVAAVYWLGRELLGKRVGLAAMLIMASFPVHLHFSRIGIANIADPVFGTLALALLARGLRTRHSAPFAWAGVMLGLTAYFYEGGRLFFLPFVLCWLGWLWLFGTPSARYAKPTLRQLGVFAVMTLLVTLPLYYTWTMHRIPLTPRLSAMSEMTALNDLTDTRLPPIQRVATLVGRIQLPLRALTQAPDTSWFYGGKTGILLFPLAPLLLWGLARACWRLRHPDGSLLFWWTTAAAVGIALISDALATARYLVLLPALAVAMGWGAVWLVEQLPTRAHTRALAGLLAVVALVQGGYYLGWHMPRYYEDKHYLWEREGKRLPDTDEAMLRAVTFAPDSSDIYIVSPNLIWSLNSTTMARYYRYSDDVRIRHVFPADFDKAFLDRTDETRPRVFMLTQGDDVSENTLRRYVALDPAYDGTLSPHALPTDAQMRLFYAPPQPLPVDIAE